MSGSVWAFSVRIFASLSGFVVNALLARLLTPDELGAYFLTFSIVMFAALVAQLVCLWGLYFIILLCGYIVTGSWKYEHI